MSIFRQYRFFRDWGHAKDYVEMQWLMLQQEKPDDFVISTGRQASVEFIEICGRELNWNKDSNSNSIIWEGEGINEVGKRSDNGEIVIKIDPRYFRLTEVDSLLGDYSKAKKKLGWSPKISLEDLIKEMIENDRKPQKKKYLNQKDLKYLIQ